MRKRGDAHSVGYPARGKVDYDHAVVARVRRKCTAAVRGDNHMGR